MRLLGLVVKSYSNMYDVQVGDEILTCRVRGKFKKRSTTVMGGDQVRVTLTEPGRGVIEEVLPRKSVLTRPPVANVDQAVVVFSCRRPAVSLRMLDRLLVCVEEAGLDVILCLNKVDLASGEEVEGLRRTYAGVGYPFLCCNARAGTGIDALRAQLEGRISVLAGESGVGKSTLINRLVRGANLPTGEVSGRAERGRHTTRNVELLRLAPSGYVVDTPGFSYLELNMIEPGELAYYFPEMRDLSAECRFDDCLHQQEPDCAVKAVVQGGQIARSRYESYLSFLEEIQEYVRNRYR